MGLLDDAIKEHLELKRRHGADPTEVARLEHEALGPARREPAGTAEALEEPIEETPAAEEPAHEDVSFFDDDDPGYSDEVTEEERLEPRRRRSEPEPPRVAEEPEELEQPTAAFSLEELEAQSEERAAAEPAVRDPEPQPEPEPEPAPEPEDPTEPHADVVPADDEPDGEDVLEETPDFLQETPEHDRLWFEQKPPRDFDF